MKLFFALIQFGSGFALPPYSALSKLITNFQTLVKFGLIKYFVKIDKTFHLTRTVPTCGETQSKQKWALTK